MPGPFTCPACGEMFNTGIKKYERDWLVCHACGEILVWVNYEGPPRIPTEDEWKTTTKAFRDELRKRVLNLV